MSEKLTITLTGRPPVKITKAVWPILASGDDSWHDGQVECQANRKWESHIIVRQHDDCRAIVYGIFHYSTNWQNESGAAIRGGELLTADKLIVDAIKRVGQWMIDNLPSAHSDQAEVFGRLINECIADLPAEEL